MLLILLFSSSTLLLLSFKNLKQLIITLHLLERKYKIILTPSKSLFLFNECINNAFSIRNRKHSRKRRPNKFSNELYIAQGSSSACPRGLRNRKRERDSTTSWVRMEVGSAAGRDRGWSKLPVSRWKRVTVTRTRGITGNLRQAKLREQVRATCFGYCYE